jgi:Ca2+-binding RTX toxin-like protein
MNTGDSLASLAGKTVSGKRLNVYNALAASNLPSVTVSVSPTSVQEDGTTNLVYTFTRTNLNLSSPLTVNFGIDGTANAAPVGSDPTDYNVLTNSGVTFNPTTKLGTVTFAANATTATVVVDPITDTVQEDNETVNLTINSGNGYIGGAPGTATGTIISEEGFTTFFSDSFANNNNGWTLGTEWQIGPATVSTGQIYGNPDPGVDYTPTTDNGVAGVVIGGNASTALHDFYYFTSPIINTSTANNLFFEYARWLNSDYTPFIQNTVDVFNGSSWVNLWSSGESPGVTDDAWTPQKFDISTYKSASTQIRFGFNVGNDGAYTVSSWNIDDVKFYGDGGSTLPVITVAATDASAAETIPGATTNPGKYTLTRTGVTTSALTVNVLMSGTATNGTDYTSIPTTATFAIGSTTALVNLNVIDDILVEQTIETAILTVGTGTGYTVGTTPSATVNITDNDLPVITVSATDASAAETIPGATTNPGQYTLTRTGVTTSALTVNVLMSGTATNGTDYTSIPTTATFAIGSTTALVNLNVIDDILVEQTIETAILTVGTGTGYTVGTTPSATVNITDNDVALPVITVAATDASAAETIPGATTNPGQYTLTRTGVTTSALTVNVLMSGIATNGTDYTNIPTTATFAIGSTTAVVNLNVIDDTLVEVPETAILTVGTGTGYIVGSLGTSPPSSATGKPRASQSTATITIADNDTPVSNIINAVDTGWYDNSGSHDPTNTNYIVGDNGILYRDWMSFNLPTFTQPVVAAQLKIKTYEYLSADASETYELRDVTTPVSTLVAGGSGLTSIYNDLGTGAIYGSRVFTSADSNQTITINLTPEAVSALNTKSGQAFALGGWLTTLDTISNSEYVFGFSNSLNPSADVQLVLSTAPALPVITVVATDASAAETIPGATTNPGQYTLTRTGLTTSALTVNVTKTGTATNGVDYTSIPTTVTFSAGSATALVPLNVIYDTLVEGTETAILNVTAGNGYAVGTTASATVSIADSIPVLPSITLASNYSGVSENSKTNLVYTFNRTGATTSSLTVNFTLGGTATRNSDYSAYGGNFLTATTGNIVFAAGATTAKLELVTTGDAVKEANETIAFTLAGGTGYTIGTPTAVTTTIINDDGVLNQQGTAGNDVIEAGKTSILSGKSGNDILIGSNSNEILAGGLGNDTLTGGAGFDTFHFASSLEGIDTLTDFNVSQDIIQASGAGFGGGLIAGESISSDQFSISLGSVTANTRFIFDKPTGKLYFDIDGSGSNSSVQFASLTANLGLTADNIFVA